MGQKEIFRMVWNNQNGITFDTGEFIPLAYVKAVNFAHILGKGAYPSYKYNPDNIILVTEKFHILYDNEGREKLELNFNIDKVNELYELKDTLKRKYYKEIYNR